jgi:hypothetical protein
MCGSRVGHPKDLTCGLKGGPRSRSPSNELPNDFSSYLRSGGW